MGRVLLHVIGTILLTGEACSVAVRWVARLVVLVSKSVGPAGGQPG